MNKLFSILFLISFFKSEGQSIEASAGVLKNYYYFVYDAYFDYTDIGVFSSYRVGVSDVYFKKIPLRFDANLFAYRGDVYLNDGAMGGGRHVSAELYKRCLGLGFYPLNLSFRHKSITMSLGFGTDYMVKEITSGEIEDYQRAWPPAQSYDTFFTFDSKSYKINAKFNVGAIFRLGYKHDFGKNWFLSPSYSVNFGLTGQFTSYIGTAKSLKQSMEFSLGKHF